MTVQLVENKLKVTFVLYYTNLKNYGYNNYKHIQFSRYKKLLMYFEMIF